MNHSSTRRWGALALAAALFCAARVEAQTGSEVCARPGPIAGGCALDSLRARASLTKLRGVLLMQHSVGGHDQGALHRTLIRLSNRYGFRLDASNSLAYINDSTLGGIDIVVFNNTETDALSNATSLAAMRRFIETRGKSMLLVHAAASQVPCPDENPAHPECRWLLRAIRTQYWVSTLPDTPARLFADSVGAGQIPANATGAAAVPAATNHGIKNPETKGLFADLPVNGSTGPLAGRAGIWEGVRDEWYNFRNPPRLEGARLIDGVFYGPVNILLTLDETTLTGLCRDGSTTPPGCNNKGTLGDRSVSWTRKVGSGLAAYMSLGHADVYTAPRSFGIETLNDSLVQKYTWRLMKYLARDFVGCMDRDSPYYNAQATVMGLTDSDPLDPCFGTSVALRPGPGQAAARARVEARDGVLRVTFAAPGPHRVRVTDVAGKRVHASEARGSVEARLEPGIYFVEVGGPEGLKDARSTSRVRVL